MSDSNDVLYHKFHPNQNASGLIPPVDPCDAIAKRIADGLAQPPRPAEPSAPALTKSERLDKAKQEARAFLSDPEMDQSHLAYTLALRWQISRQEAAALVEEVRKQIAPEGRTEEAP